MKPRLLPLMLIAAFLPSPSHAVQDVYQCTVDSKRVFEINVIKASGVPDVIDVRLNASISRPFEPKSSPLGFEECSRGTPLVTCPGGTRVKGSFEIEGVQYSLVRLQDGQQSLRNNASGLVTACKTATLYDSYCFCQYAIRNGKETTCGNLGTHFNRDNLLRREVEIKGAQACFEVTCVPDGKDGEPVSSTDYYFKMTLDASSTAERRREEGEKLCAMKPNLRFKKMSETSCALSCN